MTDSGEELFDHQVRLLDGYERLLELAGKWDAEARAMREQFAREVHPALAEGHTEANALRDRAAELRAAISAALLGSKEGSDADRS